MTGKLICVVGPTASGKTALAVSLAKHFGGEVVSCDSVQVYRGFDIGSAKPTEAEKQGIPHHLIDVAEPYERYTAGRYAEEAAAAISDIASRGGIPIVCGGTGLYLRSLTRPMADIPECPRLEHGEDAYEILRRVDPATAARLSPNDRKRIFRALDVYLHTGKPLSEYHLENPRPRYEEICVGIRWDREELYRRIDLRCVEMMEQGFLNEVAGLRAALAGRDAPALLSLGYRELGECLGGRCSEDEAVENIKRNTRRYAKRQLTWFSGQHRVNWINYHESEKKATLWIEKLFPA